MFSILIVNKLFVYFGLQIYDKIVSWLCDMGNKTTLWTSIASPANPLCVMSIEY